MEFTPEVNAAAEFLEISNDFSNPKEVVREAISNSFDAKATNMIIRCYIDRSTGEDELIISIEDDGEGMTEEDLKSFFGLGFSTRTQLDERGFKSSQAIGEKGHGTKVYFNSRRIEVKTYKKSECIEAYMDAPRQTLRRQQVPKVTYNTTGCDNQKRGTFIKICGYNSNIQAGFGHDELKDYIYWFTKFGSAELEFGLIENKEITIHLQGLGKDDVELLEFGHKFAAVNTDIRSLKSIDNVSPLDYYVAKWAFNNVEVVGKPGCKIDFVFYIEGDKAKRVYNNMIHEKWQVWNSGEYAVAWRYGLWLCKDYIPIQKKNEWVAEKSEYTKYHAFVNCQDFRLTANRGGLENTPPDLLAAVEQTVRDTFAAKIISTTEFQKYREELLIEEVERTAKQEETDFTRRRKLALSKNCAEFNGVTLFEPRQEGGVFSLFLQLICIKPDLFEFCVIDYDTNIGYDLLVTKDTALDLNQASMKFVEMKYELKRSFDHSFNKLWGIICWDCRLTNDEEVKDIVGEKRQLKITNRVLSEPNSYKKYMLVSNTVSHNIEVFVLKDYLRDKLNIEFRPRGA